MKVSWLGNSCVEILDGVKLIIDPNYVVEPKEEYDAVLITHEHSDHIDVEKLSAIKYKKLFAPEATLKEYGIDGIVVKPGMELEINSSKVKVLESWCWGAKESVSYFYKGVLHPGDSAKYPEVSDVKVAFTACFPDFYQQYIEEMKRLKPEIVVVFHYDYNKEKKRKNAEELQKLMEKEGINCKIIKPGESIIIQEI